MDDRQICGIKFIKRIQESISCCFWRFCHQKWENTRLKNLRQIENAVSHVVTMHSSEYVRQL
jgi:hypothetical protein